MKRSVFMCAVWLAAASGLASEQETAALAAQAMASVTNLIGLSLQEGMAVLDGQSKAEREAAEARVLAQLEDVRKGLDSQNKSLGIRSLDSGASKIRELEHGLKKELKRLKKVHQARLDALRQLKGAAVAPAVVKKAESPSRRKEGPVSYDD